MVEFEEITAEFAPEFSPEFCGLKDLAEELRNTLLRSYRRSWGNGKDVAPYICFRVNIFNFFSIPPTQPIS
jgi:hypothetical protein